jgi:hypothetical protein
LKAGFLRRRHLSAANAAFPMILRLLKIQKEYATPRDGSLGSEQTDSLTNRLLIRQLSDQRLTWAKHERPPHHSTNFAATSRGCSAVKYLANEA